MRNNYNNQLKMLNKSLISMGSMCENGIACAAVAILSGSRSGIEEAIALENDTNEMEREIENLCLKLLLKQQPVAGDLRLISAALKMITDMERISDQAAEIAVIAAKSAPWDMPNTEHIKSMADTASKMVTESVSAFVKRDLKLARDVMEWDDEVDRLFTEVKSDIIGYMTEGTDKGEAALDLLMTAKYLERIGDHAVNIAEWVEFSITGEHRHQA